MAQMNLFMKQAHSLFSLKVVIICSDVIGEFLIDLE